MTAQRAQIMRTLTTTPMRDLVRGRLSGRLDLERAVEEADLPDSAAAIVRRVAKRTRLTRLEKVDVAREIASHFREGLDAGRDAEELVREFGDPDAAARLIRRGKKRARGPLHKAWTRGWKAMGAAALLLLAAYSIQAVRFHTGSPTITHDYVADLNERAASVPPDERAWPIYERAIAAYVDPPDKLKVAEADPGEEAWPQVVEWVRANEGSLALIREAADYEAMGYIAGETLSNAAQERRGTTDPDDADESNDILSGSILRLLLPQLQFTREAARLLAADARLAVEEEDPERFVTNLTAMVRVAEHAWNPPTLISQLVSMSIFVKGIDHAVRLLHMRPEVLTEDQWGLLAHAFAAYQEDGRIDVDFQSERWFFYDILQRVYTDDGQGDGRLTLEGLRAFEPLQGGMDHGNPAPILDTLSGPVLAAAMASRAEVRREYDRVMDRYAALAQQEPWQRDLESFRREIDARVDEPVYAIRYLLIRILMPALGRAIYRTDLTEFMRDAALVSVALEHYRRQEGRFPDSLDASTPRYLPSIPRDIFDGEPIRYARRGDSYVLYSIGGDGDDDGGAPALDNQGDRDSRVMRLGGRVDGDWILFPPEPR